ncbi:hypothetical protein TNCV_3150951 [Trichonephila clavipes]|nr:hypothetical protein TNCV_3150951 [Trichonephila clavipes]
MLAYTPRWLCNQEERVLYKPAQIRGVNKRDNFAVCRKTLKLLGAVVIARYPCAEHRVLSDQEDHEERDRRIVRQALVDPTVTRPTIRAEQDNARPHTAEFLRLPTSFSNSSMAGLLPRFVPCKSVWDQLKRQLPSCHSVHNLELAHSRFVGPSASGQLQVSNQLNDSRGVDYCSWSGQHCEVVNIVVAPCIRLIVRSEVFFDGKLDPT